MNVDSTEYQRFLDRRKLWTDCLSGDDPNSIVNQLLWLGRETAIFKVINESRRFADTETDGRPKLNGLLHHLIDNGFAILAGTAIRRQVDSYPLEGGRGTYSLVGLLKDMLRHRVLLTRGHFFLAEGLEYDVERLRLRHRQQCERHAGGAIELPMNYSPWQSELRHAQLDILCEVSKTDRAPTDTVTEEVLEFLLDRVCKACDVVKFRVDKYLAHNATPESRTQNGSLEIKGTYQDLYDAQRVLRETTNFVAVYLVTRTNHGFLGVPQYDQLEYLDRPFMTAENRGTLKSVWDDYAAEVEQSQNWSIEDLRGEMQAAQTEQD